MRQEIQDFAEAMDAMMTEKQDDKSGWDEMHGDEHAELGISHMDQALEAFGTDKFLRQLIHAGNYAMMAWNKERR